MLSEGPSGGSTCGYQRLLQRWENALREGDLRNLIRLPKSVFPNSQLTLSSISPPTGHHPLGKTVAVSNTASYAVCSCKSEVLVDHTDTFTTNTGTPRKALYIGSPYPHPHPHPPPHPPRQSKRNRKAGTKYLWSTKRSQYQQQPTDVPQHRLAHEGSAQWCLDTDTCEARTASSSHTARPPSAPSPALASSSSSANLPSLIFIILLRKEDFFSETNTAQ